MLPEPIRHFYRTSSHAAGVRSVSAAAAAAFSKSVWSLWHRYRKYTVHVRHDLASPREGHDKSENEQEMAKSVSDV